MDRKDDKKGDKKDDKKDPIAEINDIFKMVDFMREFGIDATGLTSLEEMKEKTRKELSEKFPQGLSEGKV